MWVMNESGYLIYLNVRPLENCKFCGNQFERTVDFMSHTNEISNDACPHCGHVHNTSSVFRFNNRKVVTV